MEASFNSNSEVKFRQNLMQEKHANHNKKIIYTRKKISLRLVLDISQGRCFYTERIHLLVHLFKKKIQKLRL